MIELQTSNGNALALYSLLSGGQRNGIRVNGTLLGEIRRRGLLVYMDNQCIRSSLCFEDSLPGSCGPNEEMTITGRGSYVPGYIWNIPNPEPKYYVFYRKTLLSLLKSWEEVNEFVNKLNPAVWKYISVCGNPDREGLLPWAERRKGAPGRRNTATEPLCPGIRILQRISGALTPGIWRQICLWETLTKKFENIGRTPQLIKIYVY